MPNSSFHTARPHPKALSEKALLKLIVLSATIFLLSLIPTFSALAERPFPKPKGLVNDFANVIPPAYKQKIAAVTGALLQKTGIPIVVVTMPDIGGAEYNDYANRLYRAWGIGKKGEDKGVLLFVTVKERKMRIETGYGVEGILPDGLVGEIRDRYMTPFLKQDKFGEGLLAGALAVAQVVAKASGIELSDQGRASGGLRRAGPRGNQRVTGRKSARYRGQRHPWQRSLCGGPGKVPDTGCLILDTWYWFSKFGVTSLKCLKLKKGEF